MIDPPTATVVRPRRLTAGAWLVALAFRADPVRAGVALIPISPVCFGAIAVSGRLLIDAAISHNPGRAEVAAVIAGVALLTGFAATYLQFAGTMLRLREAVGLELDRQLLAASSAIPTLDHFHGSDYADRVELLRTGKGPLTMAGGLLTQVIFSVASLVITAALLASVHPALALAALAPLPVAWLYRRSQAPLNAAEVAAAEPRRTALHLFDVGTGLAEGKELRVFGARAALDGRFDEAWRGVDAGLTRAALAATARRCAASLVFCATLGAALAFVVHLGLDGRITPGAMFLAVGVVIGLADQGSNLANTAAQVEQTLDLAVQFLTVRDLSLQLRRAVSPAEPGQAPERLHAGIELRDVTFRYPDRTEPAVDGVNLRLAAGSSVAVVGENGAGKTTLVNLLTGVLSPTGGTILIDDAEMRSLAPEAWFERVSIVCQDYTRFELVAQESVGVGHLAGIDDADAVGAAVARAGAEPVIGALSQGLATQLGARFGGTDLSGGEWQRIAVARSMMRRQPLVLVLDEPTVSLDALTERALFDRIVHDARHLAETQGSIVVLVSHRYATVQAADLIVVLEDGRVVEQGNHAALIALGGRYATAYRGQADAYR